MKNKNCELCNGTGWYGDNGPGIRGNREYVPCEYCNPSGESEVKISPDSVLADVRAEIQKLFSTKPEDTEYNNGLMDALIIVNKVSEHFS